MKTVYVLSNIGTPEAPTTEAVKPYLTEFLTDPDVIPLPWLLRQILVRGLIVPRRSPASAAKYKVIWTTQGSPLMVNSLLLKAELERYLGAPVLLGMQFGSPAMGEAFREAERLGAWRLVFVPLYPQYAEATTGSAIKKAGGLKFQGELKVFPEFPTADFFIEPLADILKPLLTDHLLFSFHGLPESQVKKGKGCLETPLCCESPQLARCYRAQSFATARALATRLGLQAGAWSVSFQSRLGRARWIGPYTEDILRSLPGKGIRRVTVASPSFVSDCLETLEELGVEGKKTFLEAGGEEFRLAPCLNGDPRFARALAEQLKTYEH